MEKREVVIAIVVVLVVAAYGGFLYSKYSETIAIEHSYNSDGWRYFYNDDPQLAIDEFSTYSPDNNYHALTGLGWSHYYLREYEKSIEYFEMATALDMPDDFALRGLGRGYYQLYARDVPFDPNDDLFIKSEKAFLKAIEMKPDNVDALSILGRLYLNKARSSTEEYQIKSENTLQAALDFDPSNVKVQHSLALAKMLGDLRFRQVEANATEIIGMYKKLSEKNQSPEAFARIAWVELRSGNIDQAKQYYEDSLQIEESFRAMQGIGLSLLAEKKYVQAIDYFKILLEEYPGSPQVMRGLGLAYRLHGDLASAQQVFEKTISMEDRYVHGYLNLAYIYFKQGKAAQAKEMLDKALAIESDLTKLNDQPIIVECLDKLNKTYTAVTLVKCYDLS